MATKKSRITKGIIDQFFEFNVLIPTRTIYFGGDVDPSTAELAIKALYTLKAINAKKQITLIINTMGGCEYSAWAIYDTIKSLKLPVKTVAHGSCMSAGTIIFLAGDTRLIAENCVFMVHDGSDYAEGHRKNVERWAEFGKRYRRYAYRIYYEEMKKKNKRMTMEKVEDMCNLDTILTAKETVKLGLATRIL